ncbi:hypothetical protein V0R55_24765 [Pseudomonas soli]|uniref:DUF4376 domain-containing protein n=1 Tax=Pseudomonas soli TaxID=1306993 RepID=A0ABU7GYK2_9PSED|nr:hypothetical protein [Pseudomonas soli]MEE1883381.1 hypothetical protein [Pseudomonas soli]
MSQLPVPRYSPAAAHRFFVFDAMNGDHYYFAAAAERDVYAAHLISTYMDDGWDESVEQVMAGELTHLAQQVNRVERPPADQLDAQGCDAEGRAWQEGWAYYCDYELKSLDAPAVSPADVLPVVAVEGREVVIRITTDCLVHAVTCADRWPASELGDPVAVVDAPVLVADILHELRRDNEWGTNAMHRLFDEAALAAVEAGSLGVDFEQGAQA